MLDSGQLFSGNTQCSVLIPHFRIQLKANCLHRNCVSRMRHSFDRPVVLFPLQLQDTKAMKYLNTLSLGTVSQNYSVPYKTLETTSLTSSRNIVSTSPSLHASQPSHYPFSVAFLKKSTVFCGSTEKVKTRKIWQPQRCKIKTERS